MHFDIPRVVLTGGPCAGKTTALAQMAEWATDHGFMPLIVPEAATLLIAGGMDPRHPAFQAAVLSHVLRVEDDFLRYAEVRAAEGHKPVLICDRGLCDQRAYMTTDDFSALCKRAGIKLYQARDERYVGVIFLHSAAVGAEAFYSAESNTARYESLAEARALDNRTLHAWVGAPHLSIIENVPGMSFAEKIRQAVGGLARTLGVPEPLEIERKFLVRDFDPATLPEHAVASEIVQTYLVGTPGEVERVRARAQAEQWVFTHTIKQFLAAGTAVERERIVSRARYEDLLVRRDTSRNQIFKTRYCFVHAGQYCELDVFKGHKNGTVLLEIEVHSIEQKVTMPSFLQIEREVTADKGFSNQALATA